MTSGRSPNINRSRIHEEMVQRLAMQKLPGAERTLFPTIRELLCFAALLGYSEWRRVPLDAEAGVEDVSYQQFERGDAEAEIFEAYANGGLHILREKMQRSGGEFPDRDILELLRENHYLNGEDEDPDISGITF